MNSNQLKTYAEFLVFKFLSEFTSLQKKKSQIVLVLFIYHKYPGERLKLRQCVSVLYVNIHKNEEAISVVMKQAVLLLAILTTFPIVGNVFNI